MRDFIHVTDLVDAHLAVVGHVANPPVLYNVGTGKGVSVREFVEGCKRVTGAPIKVREQRESRPGDYAEVYADVTKIREELGWTARYTDLEESMGHAWAWRKAHKKRVLMRHRDVVSKKCINRDIFPHNSSLYILPVSRREIDGADLLLPGPPKPCALLPPPSLLVARSLRVAAP